MNNHQEFLKYLEKSKDAVWAVARWLGEHGHTVQVNPTFAAPTVGVRDLYRDNGDLFVSLRVEVKERTLSWTSKEDFPYPTIFVCKQKAYDETVDKPFCWVCLDNDRSHAAIIYHATKEHWKVREVYDSRFKHTYQAYECPKQFVHFYPVSQLRGFTLYHAPGIQEEL